MRGGKLCDCRLFSTLEKKDDLICESVPFFRINLPYLCHYKCVSPLPQIRKCLWYHLATLQRKGKPKHVQSVAKQLHKNSVSKQFLSLQIESGSANRKSATQNIYWVRPPQIRKLPRLWKVCNLRVLGFTKLICGLPTFVCQESQVLDINILFT